MEASIQLNSTEKYFLQVFSLLMPFFLGFIGLLFYWVYKKVGATATLSRLYLYLGVSISLSYLLMAICIQHSYISLPFLFLAIPFFISSFLYTKIKLEKQKTSNFILGVSIFSSIALMSLIQLLIIFADQFNFSRGFGVLVAFLVELPILLLWLASIGSITFSLLKEKSKPAV